MICGRNMRKNESVMESQASSMNRYRQNIDTEGTWSDFRQLIMFYDFESESLFSASTAPDGPLSFDTVESLIVVILRRLASYGSVDLVDSL